MAATDAVDPGGHARRPLPSRLEPAAPPSLGQVLGAYLAVLAEPLVSAHGHAIRRAVHHAIGRVLHVSLAPPGVSGTWIRVIEVLIGWAALIGGDGVQRSRAGMIGAQADPVGR